MLKFETASQLPKIKFLYYKFSIVVYSPFYSTSPLHNTPKPTKRFPFIEKIFKVTIDAPISIGRDLGYIYLTVCSLTVACELTLVKH